MLGQLRRNCTIDELTDTLNGFKELVGGSAFLRVRTVVIVSNDQWWNHATTIQLEVGLGPATHPPLQFKDVALIEAIHSLEGPLTAESFLALATAWRRQLDASPRNNFQQPSYVDRESSDLRLGSYPRWACRLHELVPGSTNSNLPDGPFLDTDREIFAPDVPSLTSLWLGEQFWLSRTNVAYEYRLLIPDRRARIVRLDAEGERLTVHVEATTVASLYCGVRIKTLGGVERTFFAPVIKDEASFDLGAPVQELELWIMMKDGQWLDRYSESPHRASWGRENAIYNRVASREDTEETPLRSALESGETQDVEFKPYISLDPREPKSDEFLETVCAFANSGGGTLFIGVNQHSEPIGIEVELRKTYGKKCAADGECLRNSYVSDLKRLFNEGLSPSVIPEFRWYDLAHRWIIGAFVPGSQVFVSLIKSGEVFERVGATNRRLRPIDLLPEPNEGIF